MTDMRPSRFKMVQSSVKNISYFFHVHNECQKRHFLFTLHTLIFTLFSNIFITHFL
jgi:hypothetical protein